MISFDGDWQLELDPYSVGRTERWFVRGPSAAARLASVPGIIQEVFPTYHGAAWYWKHFVAPILGPSEHALLRFANVDYAAEVWLNGAPIGTHEGCEVPFTLDATSALRQGTGNLLTVRVLNPTNEPIDGIALAETPHRNKIVPYKIGWGINYGGIMGSVALLTAPAVRITDVFVRPDSDNGQVRISITIWNGTGGCVLGSVRSSIEPASGGSVLASTTQAIELEPGETHLTAELRVPAPRLWDTCDPYLYLVRATLDASGGGDARFSHEFTVRCGFRDFRVVDGYFRLNGRRLFLRCSHTGNDFPIGIHMTRDRDMARRDLLWAKAAGFDAIRFIAGLAFEEQLDFCDEIGLMVYEESSASWLLGDSPRMAEHFDRSLTGMIRRDRNHPSVVIWGLLNETQDGPVFRHAVTTLPLLRSLDDTRLVLLSSGRMDCQFDTGSVSNPGSKVWEHMWGGEGPGELPSKVLREPHTFGDYPGGYFDRVGDAHMYPSTPHSPATIEFLRTLGSDTRPVFLSEYGIASMPNAIRVTRLFEQASAASDLIDAALYRSWAERFISDWERYDMGAVAAFPDDILQQAQAVHAAQRLLGLNAIRSNAKICGYNLTGTVDQGMTAEGLWTTWREAKPGVMDALLDGLAPLRWCLFAEPLHGYRGRQFKLGVVLANDGVLGPGDYPVRARVFGPAGLAWERAVTLSIAAVGAGCEPPLAQLVLSEDICVNGPAGKYELVVTMERGGAPVGGRVAFFLGDPEALPKVQTRVTLWENDDRLSQWLTSHGIGWRTLAVGDHSSIGREVILIGNLSQSSHAVASWRELARRMARGGTAIFVSPDAFRQGEDRVAWLPLSNKGTCNTFYNSIYHREDVAKAHPIFAGLPAGGLMDWSFYRDIIPQVLFQGQDTPGEVIAAGFALGYTCPGGYTSGIVLALYPFGAGRFMISALRLLESVGDNPVADRLLLNMINYAVAGVDAPSAPLPKDFDHRLAAIGYGDSS